MPPRISIGLPVYNGARSISLAVASLLDQTHSDFELIIRDNASTDETEELCTAFAAKDTRVRYHRASSNEGWMANFNHVLRMSGGEYFMWAACDDVWEPPYLQSMVSLLETRSQAVLAFCAFDNIDRDGANVRSYPRILDLPSDDHFTLLARFLAQPEELGKANLIYGMTRRSALLGIGGFTRWSRRDWGLDMLTVLRLLSTGLLALDDRRLFHKRLSEPLGPASPSGFLGGPRTWRRHYLARRSYYTAQKHLIHRIEHLSTGQRRDLLRLVRTRWSGARRMLWKEFRAAAASRLSGRTV